MIIASRMARNVIIGSIVRRRCFCRYRDQTSGSLTDSRKEHRFLRTNCEIKLNLVLRFVFRIELRDARFSKNSATNKRRHFRHFVHFAKTRLCCAILNLHSKFAPYIGETSRRLLALLLRRKRARARMLIEQANRY